MYFATYQRLNLHVFASNVEVIRAARLRLTPQVRTARAYRAARHAFYSEMLRNHFDSRTLYFRVTEGV